MSHKVYLSANDNEAQIIINGYVYQVELDYINKVTDDLEVSFDKLIFYDEDDNVIDDDSELYSQLKEILVDYIKETFDWSEYESLIRSQNDDDEYEYYKNDLNN